jgi:sugar phosphate isomerase/epimerase
MEKYGVADYGMYVWYGGFYDYNERVDAIKALGYHGLERITPKSPEDALLSASNLKRKGMGFATINHQDPELAIRWTAALGGEYVWAQVQGASFQDYLRQVRYQAQTANKYGVEVAVHNHLGQMIETQEQIETLLSECPNVKLLFDVGHLAVAGGDVEYIAKKYYDRIVAYHLKGWQRSKTPDHELWYKRGYFTGVGQGDFFVDNEAVFKNAIKNGFNGWIFVEHDTHKQDPLIDLGQSLDVLKKWRNEI